MLGPEGVGRQIAGLLTGGIVAVIDALAASNGPLSDGSDPTDPTIRAQLLPQRVMAAPPDDVTQVGIDDWPFVAVQVRQTPQLRRVDVSDDEPLGDPEAVPGTGGVDYEVTYAVRLSTWARGDGYDRVLAVRDRLALAVRETALRTQGVTGAVRFLETTLREEYSPVGVDRGLGATVGTAILDGQWVAAERLLLPSYGPALDLAVAVARMPDTPAP